MEAVKLLSWKTFVSKRRYHVSVLQHWVFQQKSNLVSYPREALTDVGPSCGLSMGKGCRMLILGAHGQREAEHKQKATTVILHWVRLFPAYQSLSSRGHPGLQSNHCHLFPCYINRKISILFMNRFCWVKELTWSSVILGTKKWITEVFHMVLCSVKFHAWPLWEGHWEDLFQSSWVYSINDLDTWEERYWLDPQGTER